MAFSLMCDVARQLSPRRPIMFLAELAGRPRPTAKSWIAGHRRPPMSVLERLRDLAKARGLVGLHQQLDYEIQQRKDVPRHRTGFWLIDPATGQNKANRRGRPPRV